MGRISGPIPSNKYFYTFLRFKRTLAYRNRKFPLYFAMVHCNYLKNHKKNSLKEHTTTRSDIRFINRGKFGGNICSGNLGSELESNSVRWVSNTRIIKAFRIICSRYWICPTQIESATTFTVTAKLITRCQCWTITRRVTVSSSTCYSQICCCGLIINYRDSFLFI